MQLKYFWPFGPQFALGGPLAPPLDGYKSVVDNLRS